MKSQSNLTKEKESERDCPASYRVKIEYDGIMI